MTTPNVEGPMGRTGSKVPKGYKQFQIQQFDPKQMEQYQQLFGQVSPDSFLGKLAGGDQSAYEEMEAPAMRQFSALQGNMASRFSGMGTGGRKSSGFQNTMNTAANEFAQDLQSKRMEHRRNAIKDLMGFSEMLMGQKPYETGLVQKQQQGGFMSAFGGAMGKAIPAAVSGFLKGGPPGAAAEGIPAAASGAMEGYQGGASQSIQNQYNPGNPGYGGQGQYNFPSFGV